MAPIAYLECTKCGAHLPADHPQTVCSKDGGILYVRYHLAHLKQNFKRQALQTGPATMWRYAEVLPDVVPVSLGEGFTPLLPSREFPGVYVKDEGLNPTGSFKARGMSAAVSMAKAYGLKKLAAPSAGNAGSALAAYAAAIGVHFAVGYLSLMHLLPAFGGLALFLLGLILSYPFLCRKV